MRFIIHGHIERKTWTVSAYMCAYIERFLTFVGNIFIYFTDPVYPYIGPLHAVLLFRLANFEFHTYVC